MFGKTTLAAAIIGVLTVGAAGSKADVSRPHHAHGYIPWQGTEFGIGPVYTAGASSGPQQPQGQVYDIAPAVGQAAFADTDFDNRWADLQVIIDRARQDFRLTADYVAAQQQVSDAQMAYDAAVRSVLSKLQNDPQYNDLVQKRTEEQIALKSTALGSGIRNAVASEKMLYASMVTSREAMALENDSNVQDTRGRLVAAAQTLRLKEKLFESQLYNRQDIAGARQQMETARSNKAGADGYLQGALVTRTDQLNLNLQNAPGNTVYLTGWNPYWRGYYGIGGGMNGY